MKLVTEIDDDLIRKEFNSTSSNKVRYESAEV